MLQVLDHSFIYSAMSSSALHMEWETRPLATVQYQCELDTFWDVIQEGTDLLISVFARARISLVAADVIPVQRVVQSYSSCIYSTKQRHNRADVWALSCFEIHIFQVIKRLKTFLVSKFRLGIFLFYKDKRSYSCCFLFILHMFHVSSLQLHFFCHKPLSLPLFLLSGQKSCLLHNSSQHATVFLLDLLCISMSVGLKRSRQLFHVNPIQSFYVQDVQQHPEIILNKVSVYLSSIAESLSRCLFLCIIYAN